MIKFSQQKDLVAIKVFGIDAVRYLNGRITQDIKTLALNNTRLSLILTPQGKLEGKFSVTKLEDGFLIIAETGPELSEEVFIKNLFRFKVSDQVFTESLSSSLKVFTLYSDDADQDLLSNHDLITSGKFMQVKRGGSLTLDFLCAEDASSYLVSHMPGIVQSESTDSEYLEFRIRSQFPVVGEDMGAKISGTDIPLTDYVSFTKGCYAGQEVVEMSQARGRANKQLVYISAPDFSEEQICDLKIVGQSNTEIGFVTSRIFTNQGLIGLGFIKSSADLSSSFSVLTESGESYPVTITAASAS